MARAAAAELGSMGVALGACTVPAAGRPGFVLGDAEIELGLGIHGEQGVERAALAPADALVERIMATIIEDGRLAAGERVALLVNGLGGTPPMELAIIARRAIAVLREAGLVVERAWAGDFLTALEMPGCSLSVLRLDAARLALLDAPGSAPAWPGAGRIAPRVVVPAVARAAPAAGRPADPALRDAVLAVAAALEAAEVRLTELDSAAGDGDLGLSMVRGAAALRALPDGAWADPPTALAAMGEALRRAIAGSSGPFYATALLRAAQTPAGAALAGGLGGGFRSRRRGHRRAGRGEAGRPDHAGCAGAGGGGLRHGRAGGGGRRRRRRGWRRRRRCRRSSGGRAISATGCWACRMRGRRRSRSGCGRCGAV